MTVMLKVSGDDLTGAWDSELTAASPLIVADTISGVPWYRVSSSAATKIIGKSPLGSASTTYFGFRYRATGNPASSQVLLHPFTSAGATAFRLRRGSTGTIILDGASTNSLDTSSVTATNTDYAVIGAISATVATVTIYAADGVTVIDTITATNTFGLVDNWRMGQIGTTPALPDWLFRMLIVSDTPVTPAMVLEMPAALGTKRRAVMGDSNSGENGAGPTHYFSAFVDAGLSTRDMYFWGVGGKRIAGADLTGKTAANNVADAQAWLGTIDEWIIALGTNDRPQPDATINADIGTILTAIGPTAKIIWIGLTSKATASADDIRVNNLIKAKLTARGNAVFADWDAHIRSIDGGANPSPYWLTTDTTHMTPLGYQERAAFYAAQLVDDVPMEVDGTGVLVLSGAATRTVSQGRTASGGVTLAGTGGVSVAISRSASEALVAGGAAEGSLSIARGASGVLELSGVASTTGSTDRTAGGALTIGGTASAALTIGRTAIESLTLAGAAARAVHVARTAEGGLTLGGVGAAVFHITRAALGILNLTGQGVVDGEQPDWPARLTLTATIDTLNLEATAPTLTLEATWWSIQTSAHV